MHNHMDRQVWRSKSLRGRVHGQTRSQLGAFLEIWQEPVMARGTSGHRRMD